MKTIERGIIMTKELVKLILMEQIKNTDSPIHHLLKSTGVKQRRLPEVILCCSEFCMDIRLNRIGNTDRYETSFIDYPKNDYRLKEDCFDLSNNESLRKEIHHFETLDYKDSKMLKFKLRSYCLTNDKYEIRLLLLKDDISCIYEIGNDEQDSIRHFSLSFFLKTIRSVRENMQSAYHEYQITDEDKKMLGSGKIIGLPKQFRKVIRGRDSAQKDNPNFWLFEAMIKALMS